MLTLFLENLRFTDVSDFAKTLRCIKQDGSNLHSTGFRIQVDMLCN